MKPDDLSFGTGPGIGEAPPDFTLPDRFGEPVNYAATRGDGKALILFYRSASW
jgi:peroxiredoxin